MGDRGSKSALQLLGLGVDRITDIPEDYLLTPSQQLQVNTARGGGAHFDPVALGRFLASLQWPIYYFDVETFMAPIPKFDASRPWEAIMFQWSIHRLDSLESKPVHSQFLYRGTDDPRPHAMQALSEAIGPEGTILAYFANYERRILDYCGRAFPEFKPLVKQVKSRMMDLHEPFKDLSYYHPNQYGSTSLKAVLPALTRNDYSDLEVQKGDTASLLYEQATYGSLPDEKRTEIYGHLEDYCERDTLAMIWIQKALTELVKYGK